MPYADAQDRLDAGETTEYDHPTLGRVTLGRLRAVPTGWARRALGDVALSALGWRTVRKLSTSPANTRHLVARDASPLLACAIHRIPARVDHGMADLFTLCHLLGRRPVDPLPRPCSTSAIGRCSGLRERIEEATLWCPCLFFPRPCPHLFSSPEWLSRHHSDATHLFRVSGITGGQAA